MSVDSVLSRLDRVRSSAPGEWTARCPSHPDRRPSLAVKDGGDGRILIHCFAGCPVENVVDAIGLSLSDLMPERSLTGDRLKRLPWNPRTVLEVLGYQAILVATAASYASRGGVLTAEDRSALLDAAGSIQEAISYVSR